MNLELPELEVAFMNDDHRHAAAQITAMTDTLPEYPGHPEPFLAALRDFIEHNRAHFGREESAMRESGFPPYPVHKQEHDRVLDWLEQAYGQLAGKIDPAAAERLVRQDIPAWLRLHIQTMDRATAFWIAAHTS